MAARCSDSELAIDQYRGWNFTWT